MRREIRSSLTCGRRMVKRQVYFYFSHDDLSTWLVRSHYRAWLSWGGATTTLNDSLKAQRFRDQHSSLLAPVKQHL